MKKHSYDLGITNKRAQGLRQVQDTVIYMRLHLPTGAQKKAGLSAVSLRYADVLFYPPIWVPERENE